MTLEKAIRIQTIHNDHNAIFTDAQRRAARQLGIEALKRLIQNRTSAPTVTFYPLPGETED